MLWPFPSSTQVFHVCKILSNSLCGKALHRKTFHEVLSCHHNEREAGKTHRWGTNTSQPRSLGQIEDAFSSCSLNGMKTTQLVYTIKASVTTALLCQLSHAEMVLQRSLRFPSPCHPSASHTFLLYYCYWINWQSPTIAEDSNHLSCQVSVKLQPRCISVH